MRALIQRVVNASVVVDGEVVACIGEGLVVLLGVSRSDTEADAHFIARKVLGARLWDNPDSGKRWDKSLVALNHEVLIVSQFTLYGAFKGNKPDFHESAKGDLALSLYNKVIEIMKTNYLPDRVQEGKFGTYMKVLLENNGPVTLNIDSRKFKYLPDTEQPILG